MSEAQQSDVMKNLVRFIVGLAILGILIAAVFYLTGAVPVQQAALSAPLNMITDGSVGFPI